MAGTPESAKQNALDKLAKDPDYFKKIGSKGGSAIAKTPKGFATNRELARLAGEKGGTISNRGKFKDDYQERVKAYYAKQKENA